MFNGTLMKLYIFPNSVLGLKIMNVVFSTFPPLILIRLLLAAVFDFTVYFLVALPTKGK